MRGSSTNGRMGRMPCWVIGALVLGFSACAQSPEVITAEDAAKYIGQEKTVCGVITSAKYAEASSGQPTFLNLDRPYPNQVFSAAIWGRDRHRFPRPPEAAFDGQSICVSGYIGTYDDRPQIFVTDPSSITVGADPPSAGQRAEPIRSGIRPDGSLYFSNYPEGE